MTIASEITDLQTNLANAKAAVTAKGGTVGNTGLAGLATEIATIPSGGGSQLWATIQYIDSEQTEHYVDVESMDDFYQLCYDNASGVPPSRSITINNETFLTTDIVYVGLGDIVTVLPTGFLRGCSSLETVSATPDNIKKVEDLVFSYCTSFNGDISFLSGVEEIGDTFLSHATAFNQPLYFLTDPSLTRVGGGFLESCTTFNQPIIIGDNVTTLGANFLYNCTAFNGSIIFGTGGNTPTLTTIGSGFLRGCTSFNQELIFPSSLTSINAGGATNQCRFLDGCTSFDNTVYLGDTGITEIGTFFMNGCSAFRNEQGTIAILTLPYGITKIGGNFMLGCTHLTSFNLGDYPDITAQNAIGAPFLSGCINLAEFVVSDLDPTIMTANNQTLSVTSATAPAYTRGVILIGSDATVESAWMTKLPNRTTSPYRKLIASQA